MSDLALESVNTASHETDLIAMSESDGSFGGGVVLYIEAGLLAPNTVYGLFSAGYNPGDRPGLRPSPQLSTGVMGVGDVGLWGQGGANWTINGERRSLPGSVGVIGDGPVIGVVGRVAATGSLPPTFSNAGVLGSCFGPQQGGGVIGESDTTYGVYGTSENGIAVRGDSENKPGVFGESVKAEGVFGYGNVGVHAEGQNTGVSAFCDQGIAVDGRSNSGFCGVYADCRDNVAAYCNSNNGTGLYARGGSSAAYFVGEVDINGALRVWGSPKSAVVKHPDGSYRTFYCVESTECWFEDFGEAALVNGRVTVKLARDFTPFVRTADYHVFLTPYGDSRGLFVSRRSRTSFDVREQQGGRSRLRFSYRIVARRRDIDAKRLARVKPTMFPKPPSAVRATRPDTAAPKRTVTLPLPTRPGFGTSKRGSKGR